ncbi:hypothetical protein PybrP1_010424 [[Pythium] brassicae (nom. inval.)]|nr:hypothetical protein PybrP1_010424 [[Pythium] brassicae (nom. inval.)]
MLRRGPARAVAAAARASGSRSVLLAPRPSRLQALGAVQFSSTPSPPTPGKPTIFDSLDGLSQYYSRCVERIPVFERYEQQGVFPPSSPRFSNFFLFTKLQLPPATEIDAVEFLDGARFACDLAMNTMYSREFVNFASGAIAASPAAELLQRGLSRECFNAFLFAMNESSKSGNTFDLAQLDFNGVYLVGVEWEHLSLAELKAEKKVAQLTAQAEVMAEQKAAQLTGRKVAARPEPEPEAAAAETLDLRLAIEPSDYQTKIQRMRLDVRVETKEHLAVRTADGQDQTIARDSTAVWRFESVVTTPDDVDWQIVSVI